MAIQTLIRMRMVIYGFVQVKDRRSLVLKCKNLLPLPIAPRLPGKIISGFESVYPYTENIFILQQAVSSSELKKYIIATTTPPCYGHSKDGRHMISLSLRFFIKAWIPCIAGR